MTTSNERLCDIFEMLVSRLDDIEVKLDTSTRKIDEIMRIQKHTYSIGELRASFSGLAHCGRAVKLRVDSSFDEEGVFASGLLFITSPDHDFNLNQPSMNWEMDPAGCKWDIDVREAWGNVKYDEIRRGIAKVHKLYTTFENYYTLECEYLDFESEHHYIEAAAFESALRHRRPDILAFGDNGIAIRDCKDLRSAVEALDGVTEIMGIPLCEYVQINRVDESLEPLALAYLRGTYENCVGIFETLGEHWKERALLMRGDPYTGALFHAAAFIDEF